MQIRPRPHISAKIESRRFTGCILGGAVGDALGSPFEGAKRQGILAHYGQPVTDYVPPIKKRLGAGHYTDDTALALATLESIVANSGLDSADLEFQMKMKCELEAFRGFGPATRQALLNLTINPKANTNGAAMRVAPVALYSCAQPEKLRDNVLETSRLTHSHPDAIDGALAIAFAIYTAARGMLEPTKLIQQTIDFLGTATNMSHKLREVEDLLRSTATVEEGLEHIGNRTLALESVGSAFFAFLKTPTDFRTSMVNAINAGGDTDTIGGLTGALSGSHNGLSTIPSQWLNKLETQNQIRAMAEDLYALVATQLATKA